MTPEETFYAQRRAPFHSRDNQSYAPGYFHTWQTRAVGPLGPRSQVSYVLKIPTGTRASSRVSRLLKLLNDRNFTTQRLQDVHITLLNLGAQEHFLNPVGAPHEPHGISRDLMKRLRGNGAEEPGLIARHLSELGPIRIEVGGVAPVGGQPPAPGQPAGGAVLTLKIRDWSPVTGLVKHLWDRIPELRDLTNAPRPPDRGPLEGGMAVMPQLAYMQGDLDLYDIRTGIEGLEELEWVEVELDRVFLELHTPVMPWTNRDQLGNPTETRVPARDMAMARQFQALPAEMLRLGANHDRSGFTSLD